ncbi:unnamed protein product [Hermetia illucens]|uniref:Uncharacterized protein n=1 Tax=Hermetia illucens TaxID=343691 RepID=A0A7R8YKW7_HERIL|nr:unnamed protein product [Hermetia illucens]
MRSDEGPCCWRKLKLLNSGQTPCLECSKHNRSDDFAFAILRAEFTPETGPADFAMFIVLASPSGCGHRIATSGSYRHQPSRVQVPAREGLL